MNIFSIIKTIRVLLVLSMFLFFGTVDAQVSEGGIPYSYKGKSYLKRNIDLPEYNLRSQDIKALIDEDERSGMTNRYSTFEDVRIDIRKEGLVTEIPEEEGRIWRYQVTGGQATSIQLFFSVFDLPPGGRLFIYDENYTEIYGAFTNRNNRTNNTLMIADFPGETVILEYFERYNSPYEGQLLIGSIGQGYKAFEKIGSNEDADGYINVNCSEGTLWQNQKHSVCRISFNVGSSGYLCSGAFINNVKNDGTPYFLTANHCLDTEASANTAIAFFNYETIGCNGSIKSFGTLSGATLKATAEATDYTLLLFDDSPPASYQPYYAGWDISGESGEFNAGIHHPTGKTKKIAIADTAAISIESEISWVGNIKTPSDSHWGLIFNKGRTNSGSSGSPLFNDIGQIIGQLHGGDEFADFYGKIDYSWAVESETGKTLQSFLDPEATNIKAIEGYYPVDNLSDPFFYTGFSNVCDSAGVQLMDYSSFQPTGWDWSFTPEDITFLNGTNAQSQNPVVAFNKMGLHDVTMRVTNQSGEKTQTFRKVISVGDELEIETYPSTPEDNCLVSFDSLGFISAGTESYSWSLSESSEAFFDIKGDTLDRATVYMTSRPDTSMTLMLNITGHHGKCSVDTSYVLTLHEPRDNDSIANAIEIFVGKSGEFSNVCAGIEESEPVPPFTSCTGQDSWCDEYGTGEDIVENSVWFYFSPEQSGTYKLSSEGMDNQIAVYEAAGIDDLKSGNYAIVGANDDITSIDFNPVIEELLLMEGIKYWIQVDGSAGGAEGTFFLHLELLRLLSVDPGTSGNEIKVYPQPAGEWVVIEWNSRERYQKADLEIIDLTGKSVYKNSFNTGQEFIRVDLNGWSSGFYLIMLNTGDAIATTKLIL
ncbi:MAG: T9SS type A sorting domain-containing protein [Bacteroidales bacterium]